MITVSASISLRSAYLHAWRPHDRRPIYEWAADEIKLTTDYAIPGSFHVERSRYLIEPFHAIADDQVRTVTVQKGVQSGGSLLGDCTALWTLANDPKNFYWNFPTDEQAKDYAERRARKLIETNGATAHLLREQRQRDRHKIRTTELHFPNMWMVFQGANEGNLQSHSVPMLINEELWQWDAGMYQQALARTTFFEWRKKILNISQAGEKGGDLDQAFTSGTMEEWEVPCPECRHFQPLIWSEDTGRRTHDGKPIRAGIIWETNDSTKPAGRWNFDALRPSVRYRCSKCDAEWKDLPAIRRELDDLGRYRATNPNAAADNRSFHWPSWACVDVSWASIVIEFLQAKDQEVIGNREPIMEWWRKRPAVSYDPAQHSTFELLPTITLTSDAATKKPKWELQDFVFMLVDVQREHFWCLVQAWSRTGVDLCLWAGKLSTWQDLADKQKEFEIADRCVFVDCRYRTNEVYRQCVLHGHPEPHPAGGMEWIGWTAMMGDARKEFIWTPRSGPDMNKRIRLPYSWDDRGPTWADPCLGLGADDPELPLLRGKLCPVIIFAKGTIDPLSFERRAHMLEGRTSLVAPGDWNREFSKQMQGEQPEVIVSPLGHEKRVSKRVGPNHLLDCYRMGLTAACLAKILNPLS